MKSLSAVLVCCALLTANMSVAEGPDAETTPASFEFAFLVFEGFRITPEIGVVYEPVFLEEFGQPKQTLKQEEYDDPTYKVIRETLIYDGLRIKISRGVEDPPSGWTWLNRVRISSPEIVLRHGLRIGDPVAKFESKLGPWRGRSSSDSSNLSFYAGGYGEPGGMTHGAHATVTLAVDGDGLVTDIDIRYWAD